MFTGIIEEIAEILAVEKEDNNIHFWVKAKFTNQLKVDQSIAHNGICLTVIDIKENKYKVTAIEETIKKTSIKNWKQGQKINLERAMIAGARLDGHMVQGHVDTTAILKNISDKNGSLEFEFSFLSNPECVLVNKGSICIDGTSLTVVDVKNNLFSVHIIPYTLENTVFNTYKIGCEVNIEFDIIGKYIQKIMPIYLSK